MTTFIKKFLPATVLFLLTLGVYVWFVSAGTWTMWNSPTRYYANLARGFAQGKLYLPTKPPKELQALPDPYDYKARAQAGIETPIDVSYYNGRYYLYWGPVPALVLTAISRAYPRRVGDMQIVFAALVGVFLIQTVFLSRVRREFFPKLPDWAFLLTLPIVGLAHPHLFILDYNSGARIYEAAIMSAQLFLMGGFLTAFHAQLGGFRLWEVFLAGAFWALAVGSRQTVAPAAGWMTLTLAVSILQTEETRAGKIKLLGALALPLMLGAAALGWYNWARFGSVTETGLYYQMNHGFVHYHADKLAGAQYIIPNLYNYLLMPFRLTPDFPFVSPQLGSRELSALFPNFPSIYGAQIITGLFCSAPFIVFAALPLASLKVAKTRIQTLPALRWTVLTLGGAALASFGFLLVFFWAAMRYAEDFMPSLILLSALGFWRGYDWLAEKPNARRVYLAAGVALALISIALSVLLALSINEARFTLF